MQELGITKYVSPDKLNTSSDSMQDSKIQEIATEIARSFENVHAKIRHAKELKDSIPDIKGGFLGISKETKKNEVRDQVSSILIDNQEELTNLSQNSIKFTCSSLQVASKMHKALAYLAAHGIKDVNGRVEMLSDECAESINEIVEQAYDFIKAQEAIEQKHESYERANTQFVNELSNFEIELDQQKKEQKKKDNEHREKLENLNKQLEKTCKSEEEQRKLFAKRIENDLATLNNGLCRLIDHNHKQLGDEIKLSNEALVRLGEMSKESQIENDRRLSGLTTSIEAEAKRLDGMFEVEIKRVDDMFTKVQNDFVKLTEDIKEYYTQVINVKRILIALTGSAVIVSIVAMVVVLVK